MFYINKGAILNTNLKIIDKDFLPIDEKEYISINNNIDSILKGKSHAVVDTEDQKEKLQTI